MRCTIYAILLISIFLSCSKSKTPSPGLYGKWELRANWGGSMAGGMTYPPGNGNTISFSQDQRYIMIKNKETIASGSFKISTDNSASESVGLVLAPDKYNKRIDFEGYNNKYTPKIFFELTGDTLSLLGGHFPLDYGMNDIYVKISE